MPIYDYECKACGAVEEIRHGFGEQHTDTCPKCGGEMKRRLSATGIVFKGSGFYITDSRKKKDESGSSSSDSKGTSSPSSEPKSTPSTSSEAKSAPAESKPASTSDAA